MCMCDVFNTSKSLYETASLEALGTLSLSALTAQVLSSLVSAAGQGSGKWREPGR